jgi:6-pyruvoyl-tetrahydropterin synthase
MSLVKTAARQMRADIDKVAEQKRDRLSEMDFFILDNSIRESTVGQLRGHTIENKKAIYQQVKKCGMHSIIVASFSQMARVDDEFCQWLKEQGEDFDKLFSFSEVCGGKIVDGAYDTETIPIALEKNRKYGLYNTFFEMDLADENVQWGTKFTVKDMCMLIEKRMDWVYDKINPKARILINFRDLPAVMDEDPERLLSIVEFLATMPPKKRMFALAFEDPMGESLPEELEAWTASVRKVMDGSGWKDGRLLVHIHQKWDLQTAATLDCLGAGADGVWASLCEEGAAMGHASSSVCLMNLVRLGNEKVQQTYNCKEFRKAAIEVTKLTTGRPPHPKQVVCGERALDLVFGFIGVGDFNLGDFFGEKTVNRITTLATPQMIVDRLTALFGENPNFTLEIAQTMKEKMLEDLNSVPPRKEEYMSETGLALLFDRSGGKLTDKMSEAIARVCVKEQHHKVIIEEIRELWDFWDAKEQEKGDGRLEFDSFYHGFLASYFGCYRCKGTKRALRAMDMDNDGYVDWNEFMVYIKWALHQYPDVTTADETLEIAFQKGLIPAMRDEKVKNPNDHDGFRHRDRNRKRAQEKGQEPT